MSGHTPGPWWTENLYYEAHPSNTRTDILAAAKSDKHGGTKVAEASFSPEPCKYYVDNRKEAEANARLIAAAPNLAFQLRAAANYIDALGGDSKSYRVALAEAEGAPS